MNTNLPLSYRTDALQQLVSLLRLPPTRISKLLGQTNNITINRWLDGKDIYFQALIGLCNMFNLDLLSFITYNGQTFQTNLGDIIRLEQSGLDLRQILVEKGVTPCTFHESPTLSPLTPHEPLATSDPSHPHHTPQPQPIGTTVTPILPTELLDRMIAFQCNAHEHERQMLEQQRTDLQSIIDDKDKQIAALQKEITRLKKQKPATTPYFSGMIADDSEVGSK